MTEQPETIDLGWRPGSRSAESHSTGQLTDIYLGTCDLHDRPVRHDGHAEPTGTPGKYRISCPEDGGHEIIGERLVAVTTQVVCDGSCMSARRAGCGCGCGGMNHGKSWGTTVTSQQYESSLAAYRAEKQRIEAKRIQRREAAARKAKASFDDWLTDNADLVNALAPHIPDPINRPPVGTNDFLGDLARQVHMHGKQLTENQAAAGRRVLIQVTERQAREAKWAEEKAATPPAPAGKLIPVHGEIVKIKAREGYRSDDVQLQAIVKTADGYAVQVTLPAKAQQWARDNRQKQIYVQTGWQPRYTDRTDYEGIGERWTSALKGSRLSFVAGELKPWEKDPTLGFAKSPTKVIFTPADYEQQRQPQ